MPVGPLNKTLGWRKGLFVQAMIKLRSSSGRANAAICDVCVLSIDVPCGYCKFVAIQAQEGRNIPMLHASLNHVQIWLDAFETDPGFIWVFILITLAHNSRDASERVDGPFKFTNESIESIVSTTAE